MWWWWWWWRERFDVGWRLVGRGKGGGRSRGGRGIRRWLGRGLAGLGEGGRMIPVGGFLGGEV